MAHKADIKLTQCWNRVLNTLEFVQKSGTRLDHEGVLRIGPKLALAEEYLKKAAGALK